MAISDNLRLLSLEATVATLLARVDALEARQVAEAPAGAAGARDRGQSPHASYHSDPPAERPPSAPGGDAVMAAVVEACGAGLSIRGAAARLGLDRSKVARLRQRAIAEGCLTVSPD
jgi:hypothetical protein